MLSDSDSRVEKIVQYGTLVALCTAVIFPAWAYGGTENWAVYVFAGLAGAALLFAMVRRYRGLSIPHHFSPFMLSVCFFVLFLLISMANPSHVYSEAEQGLSALAHISWLPASVSRVYTARALLLAMAYLALYLVVSRFMGVREIHGVLAVIVISGVCMAMLALLQGPRHEEYALVGMFVNDNNFAEYINLILPVTLGGARALHSYGAYSHSRSNPFVLVYFLAGILVASVFVTGSRAGAVITVLLLAIWLGLNIRDFYLDQERRRGSVHGLLWPLLSIAALVAVSGLGGWYRQLTRPVTALGCVAEKRIEVLGDTWHMFVDRLWYGTGAGTFRLAFPYYQDEALAGFYRNAHNEWLQFLAELGIVGCSLGVVVLVLAFRHSRVDAEKGYISRHVVRGLWLGLLGVALHGIVDFPFRIPAIAAIIAVWIGILSRSGLRRNRVLRRT